MKDLEKVKEYLDNALDYLKLVDKGTYGNITMTELVEARNIVKNLLIQRVVFNEVAEGEKITDKQPLPLWKEYDKSETTNEVELCDIETCPNMKPVPDTDNLFCSKCGSHT